MAELSYILKQNYSTSFDTLKNTSYDDANDAHLCQSDMQVIDFDHLTKELNPLKQPSSYDSLLVDENKKKVYCVEFKNQSTSKINNQKLYKKVENSTDTLQALCKEHNVVQNDYEFILCVVYRSDPFKHRYHRFKENIVHFGLDVYRDDFKSIVTNDIGFFKREFNKEYGCK